MVRRDETGEIFEARELADLGEPPLDRRRRAEWVRQRFVALGSVWYQDAKSDPRRQAELEDLAVDLLREHHDVLPSPSALKRAVANVSFLPMVVESLWAQAFPPTTADRARDSREWTVLETTRSKVAELNRSGKAQEAEALRRAAVAFFNKYLGSDEVGTELRRKVRRDLAKTAQRP